MTQTTIYYRLHIRDADDLNDLLVLSSKPGDPNTLLVEPPEGEGQTIDPIMGTLEIGAYTWQSVDRYDGGDTYTITSVIADEDARNQLLSNKAIGRYSTDGTTWNELHTGYLNDIKLGDAATYTFIVGDSDRRERDAVLFRTTTEQFDKVSNIIGGPVEATPSVAYQGTPTRAWGPIIDYGPVRMTVIGNSSGGSPNPANLVNPNNRVTLSLVGGNLPPRYLGFQGVWNGKIPNPAEYIDQQAYQYFEPDADGDFATTSAEQSQPWGSFPSLEVKMRRVSDSTVFLSYPIAQATKKASETLPIPPSTDFPIGDEKALVANSNDWLIVFWDVAEMGAQPTLGTAFDVWVRPTVISADNPLHLAGHPVDLHVLANEQEGIAYDATTVTTTKAALGDLYYELRITDEWEYSKFTEMLKSSAGYAVRYTGDGTQEFFPTRSAQPDEVDTVTTADIVGDDKGEPKEVVFRVSQDSAIKGVDFKLKSFRLWTENLDSASDRPVDGIVERDLTITGHRRDDSVKGSKIVKFDVPGMIMLVGGPIVLSQPLQLREWIIRAGEVIIDRAGWGWVETEVEVLATVAGQVGDYLDIEHPAQVNAKVGQDPITQRGGTRKMQIVSRTELPGTSKLKLKDAGNEAQDAPTAGDTGMGGEPFLPVPELTLAPSEDNPYTIAVVTETNVDDFSSINADTELQYLVQEATPASTDEGEFFGPLESSAGIDEIDAPAIASGETIWVRGRALLLSDGTRGEWSAWISITLGPDSSGEGGTIPPFLLALSIDPDTGDLSAQATSTVVEIETVYFLAGAAGGAAPEYDDVLASDFFDSDGPPFTATGLATMAEGEVRTVGAIGEDDLGNRTTLILASITRAVDTGAGAGTPGNRTITLVAGAPVVCRNIGVALREPRIAKRSRLYLNPGPAAMARLQADVWEPAAEGTEIHLVTVDAFEAPAETGVFVRFDRENFPEPGDFLALADAPVTNNTRFGWATKGGDGSTFGKFSNLYVEFVTSTEPPESPGGGAPFVELFDALFTSDIGVYADPERTTPQASHDGEVRGWTNQVEGATVHGIQSVPTAGPRLDTGITLNGFNSLRFEGNRNIFFDQLFEGTTQGTLFIVLQRTTTGGATSALWNVGGNIGNPTNYGDTDTVIKDAALSGPPRKITVTPSQDLTDAHIYAVRSSTGTGTWSNWINNELLYTDAGSCTYQAGQNNDATIGVNSIADPFAGYVWLFGFVFRALTDDEMATAFAAIADRYAITLPP